MRGDAFADVAALIHPLPDLPDYEEDPVGYAVIREQVLADQSATAEALRLAEAENGADPVLTALATARRDRERAEALTRRLFAYAKEFTRPRVRYTLDELAAAAGYRSPSGVATAYTHHDVADVADQTDTHPRPRTKPSDPGPDPARIEALLHDMQRRGSRTACGRVVEVYYLLLQQGWTPYPPEPRAPGTPAAKRYVRWVRQWPAGTTVTLYQESAGYLAASSKISEDDPRRFTADYAEPEHDLAYLTARLAASPITSTASTARTGSHAADAASITRRRDPRAPATMTRNPTNLPTPYPCRRVRLDRTVPQANADGATWARAPSSPRRTGCLVLARRRYRQHHSDVNDESGRGFHTVDLQESDDFWDDTDGSAAAAAGERFRDDRDELAAVMTARWGAPQQIPFQNFAARPRTPLGRYLRDFLTSAEFWSCDGRVVCIEICQGDKELPLQLVLAVGDEIG